MAVIDHNESMLRRWLPWLILAVLGIGPLLVCSLIEPVTLGGDLGLKAAPDWSRALHIGAEFYGRDSGAPMVVDGQHRAHLVWTRRLSPLEYDLYYTRLDDQGLVEEEHALTVGLHEPRRLRLLLDSEALLHVFLVASAEKGELARLFHLVLDNDGFVRLEPTPVSSAQSPCYQYSVTSLSGGAMHLFWTEGLGRARRLFYSTLSPAMSAPLSPRLLATGVSAPVAALDGSGRIHLLWEQPGEDEETAELHYQVLTDPVLESLSGIKVLDLPSGKRFSRLGPVLALDHEYAYLVWTLEYRTDPPPGVISEGWYGAFPLEAPSAAYARSFSLSMEERPTYVAHDSPYQYEFLVSSNGKTELGSPRIAAPFALAAQDEAVVTFGMQVMRGLAMENQIVNAMFGDGILMGYQLACNTTHWSRLPSLVAESDGTLHLSWVEGLEPGPGEVYYASTSAALRERADHLTSADLLLALVNTIFSTTAAIVMMPFVLFWAVPVLIWVAIASLLLGESGVRSARGSLALTIGLVVYLLTKFYSTPELLTYVPFSISVPFLPASLHVLLQIAVPLCIAGMGVLALLYAMLRAGTRSLLTASLAFVISDAFLTALVYSPGFALGR